jgi:putative transposase
VDADEYLQEISRYIHLNPIRMRLTSGMTLQEKKRYLRNYRWSSYGGYISTRDRKPFLRVGEVLAHFGGDTSRGKRRYEGFVMEGLDGKTTNPLERGRGHGIVGAGEFIEKIRDQFLHSLGGSREIPAMRKIVV